MKKSKRLMGRYWLVAILCITSITILDYFFGTVCYLEFFFGIPCPFCGITRAAKLMLTGNFVESFRMHPLLIFVIIGVFLYIFLKGKSIKCRKLMVFYGIVILIFFISFYIYRMNVYYPDVEPMVYRENNALSWIMSFLQ